MLIDKLLPAHFMMEWNCQSDYPGREIYPTSAMQQEAAEKVRAFLKNSKG